jgi:hypothetical protein
MELLGMALTMGAVGITEFHANPAEHWVNSQKSGMVSARFNADSAMMHHFGAAEERPLAAHRRWQCAQK